MSRPIRAGALGATLVASVAGLAALFAGAAPAATPAATAAAAAIPQTNCFWTDRLASKYDTAPDKNYAFPDSGAVYWTAQITMPAGAKIVLKGQFPHARYESINSYDATSHAATDALNDVSTKPDAGSANPFKPGASRTARKRAYTATVLNQPPTGARAANTLYAGVAGQTTQALIYRVYDPDSFKKAELTGGVGLPKVELHLADGTVQGGAAACKSLKVRSGPLPVSAVPESLYSSLRNAAGSVPTFPAVASPVFQAFYNTGFVISCWYKGSCSTPTTRTGGQYSNIDNQYVAAFVNRGFSSGPVLVLKGKLPTTPSTGPKAKKMGKGQLRYWSMCQNESLYTTKGAGCVYDSQIPVDKHGNFTIVTSAAGDRPKNATARCGVAYIPWPKSGDGDGHLKDGFLIMRNMLPAASFKQAIQNTRTPGDEAKVMGPYLPKGTYTTKAAFQKRGC